MENTQFDGVFRFTNSSDEDFKFMWNNKEYTFPAKSTTPMIMPQFSSEEIQSIRKKAAYKYAVREFAKSKEGIKIAKEAAKHFSPAVYDEKVLQPFIDSCLQPLPVGEMKVKELPPNDIQFKDNGSAIVGEESLESISKNAFKDYVPPVLGKMSE